MGDEGRNGLEAATDVVVDQGIPDRKWVEPTKQANNLLGDSATLRGCLRGMKLELL